MLPKAVKFVDFTLDGIESACEIEKSSVLPSVNWKEERDGGFAMKRSKAVCGCIDVVVFVFLHLME